MKDPYNFDFLSLREEYDEKELEDALVNQITQFLLELGTGFSYIDRQVHIKVGETDFIWIYCFIMFGCTAMLWWN